MSFSIDDSERARKQAQADLFNVGNVGYQEKKARKRAYNDAMRAVGFF